MKARTIIITGASRGLGFKLAEYYCRENTVIGLSRSGEAPKGVESKICDLSKVTQIQNTMDEILKSHPKIDVLINNAAVLKTAPLALMSDTDIEAMIQTNFLGVVLMSKSVLRRMIKQKSGRIVNIISMSHKMNVVGDSVYAATKAAVESFSKILNHEGHAYGVTVNNIGLSAMPSGMLDQITKEHPEKVKQIIPHGEYASLESVVHALETFCAESASDLGGQSLYLGGV